MWPRRRWKQKILHQFRNITSLFQLLQHTSKQLIQFTQKVSEVDSLPLSAHPSEKDQGLQQVQHNDPPTLNSHAFCKGSSTLPKLRYWGSKGIFSMNSKASSKFPAVPSMSITLI